MDVWKNTALQAMQAGLHNGPVPGMPKAVAAQVNPKAVAAQGDAEPPKCSSFL